ncbi:HipA family kinase [Brevibacterium sp. CT2-23B]|uniref:HipA family kinase n=1 Tax=Brevibacterium sp. CT2-23B TaxID=2729630 RepID=UPI001551D3A9|nr:HipA family kinase [Brevibacterium sp. CT2-23B]
MSKSSPLVPGAQKPLNGLLPGLSILRDEVEAQYGSRPVRWGEARALIKLSEADHPNMLLYEFLGERLALALGLPVPLGEVAKLPDASTAWVSALAGKSTRDAPPVSVSRQRAFKPQLIAKLLVFDAWIHNDDRTEENLIAEDKGSFWAIDHEGAFFGQRPPSAELAERLARTPVYRHLDEGALTIDPKLILEEAECLKQNGMDLAFAYCTEARLRKIAEPDVIEHVYDLLERRHNNLLGILKNDLIRCGHSGGAEWQPSIFS